MAVSRPDEACVSRSDAYTIHVCLPAITTQPASANYDLVTPVTLSVVATSSQPMTYQWYLGVKGDTTDLINGATSSTYNAAPTVATSYWCRITSCASVDSEAAVVTPVCQSAAITNQPAGGSITRGQSLTIGVNATGSALTYQWYAGTSGNTANPVYGSTPSITVNPLDPADYWVKVTAPCNGSTVNSSTAHVSVCTTPVITTPPVSTNVFNGQSATLTVAATEATSEPLHYQWFIAGGPAVGTDLPTFVTPPITQPVQYYVRVTAGACSVESSVVTVGVCTLPQVLNTGTTQNVAIGQNVTLSCLVSPGTGNTFVWYRGPVGDVAHSTQVSANSSSTYSFFAAADNGGTYWATVARNDEGCVSNTSAYTVNVCIPAITTQPAPSTMINSGQSTTLTVAANTAGLTYQWYIGSSGTTTNPIAGATSASVSVSPTSNTNYWVKVTGSCGQPVNSNTAAVTICQPAAITMQPAPLSSIVRGQNVTLNVTATGNGLTYQWYQGTSGNTSTPLGSTSASLTLAPQNPVDYWVKVTGTCGAAQNSNTAHVAVCTTPVINTQPQSTSTFSGTSATLSVSASEATSEPLHYQWFKNNVAISGNDSATLNTGALTADTTFFVRITAASGTCSIDSTTATVTMCALPQSVTGAPNQNTTPGQSVRLQLPSMPGATAYQWYAGTSGNTSAPVGGWQAANYLDVSPSTTSSWWAQVQNGSCVSSTTTTTVNVCIPTITTQPQNKTIPSGSTTLSVVSNLTGSTYQWYVGTSGTTTNPISGATSASVTVSPATTTSYWCKVTGPCGTANSNTATVTICTAPNVTGPANATPVQRYSYATLSVSATGTNLTYQWYAGASGNTSQPVSGATSSSFTIQAFNSEQYWVRVTGMCGTVNSASAWISVNPIIVTQPQSQTYLTSGSRASLTVNAQGSYLHYQWTYDSGLPVAGAPDSALFVSPDLTASTVYYCHVTSGIGGTDTYRAYVNLCDNGIYMGGGPIVINQGGNCRQIWANAGGVQYDHIEWYQGTKGNTSILLGSGDHISVCPATSTNYWFRVYATDPNQGGVGCYTDSATLTLP